MFAGSTKRFYRKKFFVPWAKTFKGQTILTVISFVIFAVSVLYIFWNLAIADGSGQYAASDVLGEFKAFSGGEFGAPANIFGFWNPTDVVVDSANHRLFVADGGQFYNNRVLIYDLDASDNFATQSASFVLGEPDFTTIQGYVAPVTQSTMQNPSSIAYDDTNNRLFVSDTPNNRILVFNLTSVSNGMAASNVLGQTDFVSSASATTQSGLHGPKNLAFDDVNQLLYVNDSGNKRVLEYDLSSSITNGMNAAHVLGAANFTTLGGGGGSSGFTSVTGVALDTNNNRLFVTDGGGCRVLEFDLTSISDGMAASHVLGAANPTLNGTCTVTQHNFKAPNALTYDTNFDDLYVSDPGAFRILKFDLSGGLNNNMNATLVFGQTNFTNSTIPTSPTQSNINESFGMSYDTVTNHLYAADLNYNRIMNFDFSVASSSGENASSELGQTDLNNNNTFTEGYINDFSGFANQFVMYPKASVVDPINHRLYVADYQGARVMIYNLDSNNNFVDHTAIAELGEPNYETIFSNGSPPTQANLSGPTGIAIDSTRNLLFVEDPGFDRVLVYDLSGSITNGMNAAFVIGQQDFVTNDTVDAPSDSLLSNPSGGLVFDPTTNLLYVGDTGDNRVMVFDTGTITNGMSASHVLGQPDFTTKNSNITQAGFSNVSGLALDPSQNELFVGDAHRALVFDISTITDNMNATHVLGEPSFVADPWASNVDNKSFNPFGFAFDNHNQRLFVEDQNNDRILSFDFSSGIVDGMAATGVIGQSNFTNNVSDTIPPTAYDFGTVNGTTDAFDTTNNRLYVSDGLYGRLLIFNFVTLNPLTQSTFNVGDNFSQVLGSQFQGTPSYSVTSGTLPPGTTLDSASGDLGGIFTTPGVYNFTVKVIDNNSGIGSFSDFQPYSMTVNATSSATPTDTPAVSGSPTDTPAPTAAGPTSTPGPSPTPTGTVTAPSTGLGTNKPNILIASMAAGSSAITFFSGVLLLHKRRRI